MNKIFHLGFVPVKKLGKSLLLKYGLVKVFYDVDSRVGSQSTCTSLVQMLVTTELF
jgi:hypothetical protein